MWGCHLGTHRLFFGHFRKVFPGVESVGHVHPWPHLHRLFGHPATASIFWGAARYFMKLLLYSVIWAITLVGLYLIPNINWGVETIGVNSLLTAVAVLGRPSTDRQRPGIRFLIHYLFRSKPERGRLQGILP